MSMPRTNSTKICGFHDRKCYYDAADTLRNRATQQSIISGVPVVFCNCLPPCTTLTYDPNVMQTDFDLVKILEFQGDEILNDSDAVYAIVTIYFTDTQFLPMARSEVYGLTDFVANCGGLLGEVKFLYFD